MKKLIISGLIINFGFVSVAMAAPCVSDTFDRPLPGATGVVSHVTDVPSVQFPAFWQEGFIGGFSYQIFANEEGFVRSSEPTQDWVITVLCDGSAQACDLKNEGDPPQEAVRVASVLGQCLLRSDVDEADFAQTTATDLTPPTVDVAESTAEVASPIEPTVAAVPAPCGLATVNEASDVATMQRLMALIGSDPGPVDGFLGPQTFKAMEDFVDQPGWETSTTEVITLLDTLLCERGE